MRGLEGAEFGYVRESAQRYFAVPALWDVRFAVQGRRGACWRQRVDGSTNGAHGRNAGSQFGLTLDVGRTGLQRDACLRNSEQLETQSRSTTQSVQTGLGLGAIRIEHAHAKGRAIAASCKQQQAVTAYRTRTIGERPGDTCPFRIGKRDLSRIVHLVETIHDTRARDTVDARPLVAHDRAWNASLDPANKPVEKEGTQTLERDELLKRAGERQYAGYFVVDRT